MRCKPAPPPRPPRGGTSSCRGGRGQPIQAKTVGDPRPPAEACQAANKGGQRTADAAKQAAMDGNFLIHPGRCYPAEGRCQGFGKARGRPVGATGRGARCRNVPGASRGGGLTSTTCDWTGR